MAHKQVLFRSAAREKILRGATQLVDAIRVTLGPQSKSGHCVTDEAPIAPNDQIGHPAALIEINPRLAPPALDQAQTVGARSD